MLLDQLSVDRYVGLVLNGGHQNTDTIIASRVSLENADQPRERTFLNAHAITGLKVVIHFDHAVLYPRPNELDDFFMNRHWPITEAHDAKNASGVVNFSQRF